MLQIQINSDLIDVDRTTKCRTPLKRRRSDFSTSFMSGATKNGNINLEKKRIFNIT